MRARAAVLLVLLALGGSGCSPEPAPRGARSHRPDSLVSSASVDSTVLDPSWIRADSLAAARPLVPGDTLRVTPLGRGHASTAVLIQLAGGARVPGHVHRAHDEVVHVLRGACRMRVWGYNVRTLVAGDVVLVPMGMPHGAVAGPSGCAVISVYAPVWDPADRVRDPRGDP
jgi:quercetin dioxygenase-like cupin family protein